jgi:hypothetical protein
MKLEGGLREESLKESVRGGVGGWGGGAKYWHFVTNFIKFL